eukprot:TRINITY_DN11617_c0_g2_i1.p1 TRINITY_DN11617_c0_g2~~TRINITY_DN11617_c0_g2_i1.p1  ORF type:complete len:300 (+),score=114.20 TRINITY_DN11617_c0_g2_i1:95-994(+)
MDAGFLHKAVLRMAEGQMDSIGFRGLVRQLHRKGSANYYLGERWEHEGWEHTPLSLAVDLGVEDGVKILAQQARAEILSGKERGEGDAVEQVGVLEAAAAQGFSEFTMNLLTRAKEQMARLESVLGGYPLPEASAEWVKKINVELNSALNPWAGTDQPGEFAPNVFIAAAEHVAEMKGVTAIVNCCPSTVDSSTFHPEAAYLPVDADDDPRYPIISHARDVVDFITRHLEEHPRPRVVIHCYGGINRAGATSVGFLMVGRGVPLLEAVRTVYRKRPIILSNVAFREQLVRLAHKCDLLA